MKRISHHYHPLAGMGALEHEHLVNAGRPHVHLRGPGDEVDTGPSVDELPVPDVLRGEAHRTPMQAYTLPKPD